MRQDAKRLLSILGKQELNYHEFSGRFSDLELCPLFDELLDDPRLSCLRTRSVTLAPATSEGHDVLGRGQDARAILGQLTEMAAAGTL